MIPSATPAMVAICASCVVIGAVALYIVSLVLSSIGRSKRKPTRQSQKRASIMDRVGTMNIILVIVGVMLLWFTLKMIDLFEQYGMIPDTLVNCVFVCLGGECGILGWIKTTKEKYRDRSWQKEDEQAIRKAAQAAELEHTKEEPMG